MPVPLPVGAHFGDVGAVRRLGELVVAESWYQAGLSTPYHLHEAGSLTLTLEGSYIEEFPRTQLECRSGSVLLRPAGEMHRDRMGEKGAHCVMVEMPCDWLQRMQHRGLRFEEPRQVTDRDGVSRRIRREVVLADELSGVALESLVVELVCDAQRRHAERSGVPRWLQQIRERIEAEFRHLPELEALAAEAGVHPAHMARTFRRHFGCTIGEYARTRRIECAREQLRLNRSSLSEIAVMAGFANQAHFTRLFKIHTGMTPAEFRRSELQRRKRRARTSTG